MRYTVKTDEDMLAVCNFVRTGQTKPFNLRSRFMKAVDGYDVHLFTGYNRIHAIYLWEHPHPAVHLHYTGEQLDGQ